MMHNKKLSWLSLTLLLVLALTALVACGVSTDAEEKILGVSGLKESYYQGQELDFADVVVTYQDVGKTCARDCIRYECNPVNTLELYNKFKE